MNKIILVTGANRGIGLEIVKQLAKAGHTLILTARDEVKGREVIAKLKQEGLTVYFIQLDVSNRNQIIKTAEEIKNQFGKLDVLINNAAIMPRTNDKLFPVDENIIMDVMNTNAWGPLYLTDAVTNLMSRGGRIVNISSGGGSFDEPVGGWAPLYCISKSLLNTITRHADYYLSPKGITVNTMCPGWVKTDMGGQGANRSVEHGAETAVWLATAENIPGGKFWRDKKEIPW